MAAFALGNCYSPSVENCQILCGAAAACPDGLHCSAGYCTNGSTACELAPGENTGGGAGSPNSPSQEGGAGTGSGGRDGGAGSSGGGGAGSGGGAACSDSCATADCEARSCVGLGSCAQGNCCASELISGGTFLLGRGSKTDAYDALAWETPEHTAHVSDFRLDRFEVTVGRFRRFVEVYDGCPPTPDSGAHPNIEGSGWNSDWNAELPKDRKALEDRITCAGVEPVGDLVSTFTPTAGDSENKPIVCVDWYVPFAFCVWDGGRLPTETEWEYAAAGGTQNRLYPWAFSYVDTSFASYNCLADGAPNCTPDDLLPVGSLPLGKGSFEHFDLAGNAAEWVLDWSGTWYGSEKSRGDCASIDCANLDSTTGKRVQRGGSFAHFAPSLRAAQRTGVPPDAVAATQGVRCAREP